MECFIQFVPRRLIKMASRDEIISYINSYLNSYEIKDISRNGLQIEGKEEVNIVAFGVSASLECMKKAAKGQADMLITHHGLLWGHEAPFTGVLKRKLEFMFKHNMSLCAWHLPLDMHPDCGNNAQLIRLLGAEIKAPFGLYHGIKIGLTASFSQPQSIEAITTKLKKELNSSPIVFSFGTKQIKNIAVVSGGASDMFSQAIEAKADLYITGEPSEQSQELARETNSNFIAAGHYNTEKGGVQCLAQKLKEKFNVKTFFADIPNPV